jgi:acetyl-CoA acetyltransferase
MNRVKIISGAMTRFGRHLDWNLKSLVAEAVRDALKDAGLKKKKSKAFGSVMLPKVFCRARNPSEGRSS